MNWRPTLPRRWWLAAPLAIAALALSWQFNRPLPDADAPPTASGAGKPIRGTVAPPASEPNREAGSAADTVVLATTGAAPSADDTQLANIFAVRTWEPPPPPVDTTPLPPQAPPLPFTFLGRIVEPGKAIAFILTQGLRVFVVSVGDQVGGDYRIEKYENGQLLFRYRPLNIRQSLDVGVRS